MEIKMSKKFKGRKRFYVACVQYVKKRQNGFIHPKDVAYVNLVRKLEAFAGLTNVDQTANPIDRCRHAAELLGIKFPQKRWTQIEAKKRFYSSQAWKKLRYVTLKKYGAKCQCCGVTGKDAPIRIDHIKPISRYWELRLDPNNMQVLCNDCNWGKLNIDETDWRPAPKRVRLRLISSQ